VVVDLRGTWVHKEGDGGKDGEFLLARHVEQMGLTRRGVDGPERVRKTDKARQRKKLLVTQVWNIMRRTEDN